MESIYVAKVLLRILVSVRLDGNDLGLDVLEVTFFGVRSTNEVIKN